MRALFVVLSLTATLTSVPAYSQETKALDAVNDVVIPMFDAVLAEDIAKAAALLTPDAKIYAMFNPSGETDDAAIRVFPLLGYFSIVTKNYDNIAFLDRSYSVADNGKTVWMEAEGDLRVTTTGKPYRNRYVFKVTISGDGKVSEMKEWVNTVTLTQQGIRAQQ